MSKFLGLIHYWIFNKIRLYEELESDIIETIREKLNVSLSLITSLITALKLEIQIITACLFMK